MTKRIGLLTLPLDTNYGGILQIVALYQFLADNGHQPLHLRKRPIRPLWYRVTAALLRQIPGQNIKNARANGQARAQHYPFMQKFMPNATKGLQDEADFRRAAQDNQLDAVIVGSDQVWRFEYHSDDAHLIYFLNFVDPDRVRRISYAASFGRSSWAYPEHTEAVKALLGRFHAVSVRETTGLDICRDALDRPDATVVLDPTLLVDPAFYDKAVAAQPVYDGPRVVTYVLDQSDKVQRTRAAVSQALGAQIETFSLTIKPGGKKLDIPQWLRAIRDADFVMTDSFHGTVFAILFQKPFVTIPNAERGLDRFTSLLGQLGLTDRLLVSDDAEQVRKLVHEPIDYDAVAQKLAPLRQQAAAFLLSALD